MSKTKTRRNKTVLNEPPIPTDLKPRRLTCTYKTPECGFRASCNFGACLYFEEGIKNHHCAYCGHHSKCHDIVENQ